MSEVGTCSWPGPNSLWAKGVDGTLNVGWFVAQALVCLLMLSLGLHHLLDSSSTAKGRRKAELRPAKSLMHLPAARLPTELSCKPLIGSQAGHSVLGHEEPLSAPSAKQNVIAIMLYYNSASRMGNGVRD